jgi:hypothetical protein
VILGRALPRRKGGRLLPSRRGCPGPPAPKRTSGLGLVIEAPSTIGVPLDVANQPSAGLRTVDPLDGELVAGLASNNRGLNRPPGLRTEGFSSAGHRYANSRRGSGVSRRLDLTESARVSWRDPPFVRCDTDA